MLQRGSTSIGTGSLDCIVYVQDDVLNMEYYTDIYAVVEGSQSAEAFTEAYNDLMYNAYYILYNHKCMVS